MKKNLVIVLVIAIIFSAASIFTMINNSDKASSSTGLKSVTQGDWQPESFEKQDDSSVVLNDQLCKNFENEKSKKIKN
ncbi:MAG: hypothetical protein K9N09_10120 [Candidatus Cloacimonetes bacterium]|nr:hypothetical protein [Candidatus Cloacimonadota bacterium]MCF7814517.1 hypothetical protein [Candidatus Cloacimonadota bacterium]MCF7869048.1 hypothetical protein [Candidatus Cloacimonadota bacterium]MCF7884443.1 hypothetical protein [Candidatus Cloacimonadota bacterium]